MIPYSCRGRSFCPSCEKKRSLLWAEWLRQEVLEPVPHRHVVVTIPRLLRPLFRHRRDLLRDLGRCAADALGAYVEAGLGEGLRPGIVVSIATAGDLVQWHPHLHMLASACMWGWKFARSPKVWTTDTTPGRKPSASPAAADISSFTVS